MGCHLVSCPSPTKWCQVAQALVPWKVPMSSRKRIIWPFQPLVPVLAYLYCDYFLFSLIFNWNPPCCNPWWLPPIPLLTCSLCSEPTANTGTGYAPYCWPHGTMLTIAKPMDTYPSVLVIAGFQSGLTVSLYGIWKGKMFMRYIQS